MGQPITVIEKPSVQPGVVRFEINRSLTGMDRERYVQGEPIIYDRPPDRLAAAILERGGVEVVQIYANIITVELERGAISEGLTEIIEGLYTFYRPGVEVVIP